MPPQRQGGNAPASDFGFRLAQLAVWSQHPRPDMAAMMVQALATPFEKGDPMPLALQAQAWVRPVIPAPITAIW